MVKNPNMHAEMNTLSDTLCHPVLPCDMCDGSLQGDRVLGVAARPHHYFFNTTRAEKPFSTRTLRSTRPTLEFLITSQIENTTLTWVTNGPPKIAILYCTIEGSGIWVKR